MFTSAANADAESAAATASRDRDFSRGLFMILSGYWLTMHAQRCVGGAHFSQSRIERKRILGAFFIVMSYMKLHGILQDLLRGRLKKSARPEGQHQRIAVPAFRD